MPSKYYPLGLQIPDRVFVSGSQTKEGYTGHELDPETGDYYAGARYYLSELGRWTAMDPLAEKYPSLSPYNYAANSPIMVIDPDGRDIIVHYTSYNDDGEEERRSFTFTGSNYDDAPENEFVQQFLEAYRYTTSSGGGQNLLEAATSSNLLVNLRRSDTRNSSRSSMSNTIRWNPNAGLITQNGSTVLSPAVGLEHEFAHQVRRLTDPGGHERDVRTNLEGWTNAEERRVITGPERRTAAAVGEWNRRGPVRDGHNGSHVMTYGPTSTETMRVPDCTRGGLINVGTLFPQ